MKSILITGISGFLGSNLCRHFKNNGYRVLGTTYSERNTQIFMKNNPGVKTYLVDISSDYLKLENIFMENEIDYVVHCAAMKHVNISENNPTRCVKTNIMGSLKIIELCKKYNVKNLMAISTDKSNNPSCVYGMSKHLMERIVLENNFCVYRGVNFFGSTGSVIDIWNKQSETKKPLTVNSQDTVRYFISINKVCEQISSNINVNGYIYPTDVHRISLHNLLKQFMVFKDYKDVKYFESGKYEKYEEEINENINWSDATDQQILKLLKEQI